MGVRSTGCYRIAAESRCLLLFENIGKNLLHNQSTYSKYKKIMQ